ncbi:extensin family protein [Rhizobium sp. L1K21]|uniref:extensin-like domain-containing protein n=1 Tax=Rhizobium sp. L1K21 TaxID=2954933 RepID=UPI002093DC0D|nr:extensin family protein [Rhizobium sp. L1K21]MCO6186230.1 extensin family protein [Rhizobium sp. L1K21]
MAYTPFLPRSLLSVVLMAGLTSCYDDLAPPATLGPSVRAAPVTTSAPTQVSYAAPENPVSKAAGAVDYLNTPNLAGVKNDRRTTAPLDQTEVATYSAPPEVNMDGALGLSTNAAGEPQIAEANTSEPVIGGIGTDRLVNENSQQTSAGGNLWEGQPLVIGTPPNPPAAEPEQIAFNPGNPIVEPQAAPQTRPQNVMPASELRCRAELKRLGGVFKELPPIHDSASCNIPYPLKLEAVSGDIDVKPDATLNCQMALTFAKWVKDEVVPAARIRYLSGVKSIRQMSSYSCRRMNSSSSNPWSEHASGNAIDVGEITLNNGKEIDVRKKGFFAFREKGLLKAVRSDSCKYFNTVLGPGSDRHHKDHFHFDLRDRHGGKRYCSMG